jgi:predicted aspartyl protease
VSRWMLLALAACAPKLGRVEVSYGAAAAVPLVQPSTDARRWYVPMETEAAGPVVWFVDTGYTYTTCDDDLVEALGLTPRGEVEVRGELGVIPASKVVLPPMELGGHTVSDLVCIVRDLGSTSSLDDPTEVPIAGVIGMDLLRRFRLRFDPREGVMTLLDPGSVEPLVAGDEGVHEIRRKGLRARVALDVGGERIWPILDTGASHTYVDGEQLGLEPSAILEGVEVRGTGATGSEFRRVISYELPAVQVSDWTVERVTVTDRTGRWREPGLVGLDLLSRFEQDYDFASGLARFTPTTRGFLPTFAMWQDGSEYPARLRGGAPQSVALGRAPADAAEAEQ